MSRGYIETLQWYHNIEHIDDFQRPKAGDAAEIDKMFGYPVPIVQAIQPIPLKGHVVFRVEDCGRLILIATNYDSSG